MEKDLFIKACKTLLWSWGSDTPPEAIWGLNDMLKYFRKQHNVDIPFEFQEVDDMGLNETLLDFIDNL